MILLKKIWVAAHTVLHDITNNAKLVEVTTTALSAERLLKCDLRIELDLSFKFFGHPINLIPGRCQCGDGSMWR